MNTLPTSDEKIAAALAHGSIFFAFLGPIVPTIIWASQRKKSKYVCFHALQAMGYQTLMFWLWFATMILIIGLTMCLAFPLSLSTMEESQSSMVVPFFIQVFMFLSIFGTMGLFFLAGIIGAVFCLLGRDFRYPFIGKRLEQRLPYSADSESPISEEQEDNWVAGVCHATTILQLMGIITPLIVWFTQKERSARLRFQSMQAIAYQGIAIVAYIAGTALQALVFFGMFFSVIAAGVSSENGEIQGPAAAPFLILILFMMLFGLVSTILVPLYYLLAAYASVRVTHGYPFRYPIIGNILEKRMQIPPVVEPTA